MVVLLALLVAGVVAGCGDDTATGDPARHELIQEQTDCKIIALMVASDGLKALRGDKVAAAYRETALETYKDVGCEDNGRLPHERIEDLVEEKLRAE